jgi:hypothetical protein
MDKTNLVIDLWVGLNGGYITTDEYKDMTELQNLDDGSQSDKEMALESENYEFVV